MSETKLRKKQYIPFLDTSDTINTTTWTPTWNRIDRSTIFSLNPNPQTEEMDYISYETPVTEVDHYTPELPQEIALYKGNPIYEFVFGKFYNLPVGSECYVPTLVCFAPHGTEAEAKEAWQIQQTTLTLGEMNTVDGKISFTLNFGGDIERGTYTVATDGTPTFTKASA